MKIKELFNNILIKEIIGNPSTEITDIQIDSREITENNLFICIKGQNVDGHEFYKQAIENGATSILSEKKLDVPPNVTLVIVPDTFKILSHISCLFYQYPANNLQLIGITGTNGKTTTTTLIETILNKHNIKTGLIGTIHTKYDEIMEESINTTPQSIHLQKTFKKMIEKNVSHVSMEVSSHALQLGRVSGCDFKIGVFTNFTQDHLDFHKTMEEYKYAKSLLFSKLKQSSYAIFNNDDNISNFYKNITDAQILTYGIYNPSDIQVTNIEFTSRGTRFTVKTPFGNETIITKLIGEFNIYNILAAITVCLIENMALSQIKSIIEEIEGIRGRFEAIYEGQEHTVIIDYAHTPDSLENVLKTAKSLTTGNLTCVIGCGGNRDKSKRPIMAKIAEKYSDYVILTSDNPRNEDPLSIINDMETGLSGTNGKNYRKLINRKRAIEEALMYGSAFLKKGDCIVIAGKGHETYQVIGNETFHFDDKEIATEIIRNTLETIDYEPEDGVYAIPIPKNSLRYKIRDMHKWCLENGLSTEELTEEQRENFIIKK